MQLVFTGEIIYWRGPAPWYFVEVPEDPSSDIQAIGHAVTYGWGVIPVEVQIGDTVWTTSLFPKDGRYLVPVKARIRQLEDLDEGDMVTVYLTIHE